MVVQFTGKRGVTKVVGDDKGRIERCEITHYDRVEVEAALRFCSKVQFEERSRWLIQHSSTYVLEYLYAKSFNSAKRDDVS